MMARRPAVTGDANDGGGCQFSDAFLLLSYNSMDSRGNRNEDDNTDDDAYNNHQTSDFEFPFGPSVFHKDSSRVLPSASTKHRQRNVTSASLDGGVGTDTTTTTTTTTAKLDNLLSHLPALQLPVLEDMSEMTLAPGSTIKSSCLPRDLQQEKNRRNISHHQEVKRGEHDEGGNQEVKLAFRPCGLPENSQRDLFELHDGTWEQIGYDCNDTDAREDLGSTSSPMEDDDEEGGDDDDDWINRMIPFETPSSTQELFRVATTNNSSSPPSTPPPRAVRLGGSRRQQRHHRRHHRRNHRRHHHRRVVDYPNASANYQSFYNTRGGNLDSTNVPTSSGVATVIAGEHLSNDEWMAQRRRREQQQRRRRLQREREGEQSRNGTQVVYRDENAFSSFAGEDLDRQRDGLLQQQLMEHQRLQLEVLQAVEDQDQRQQQQPEQAGLPIWLRRPTQRRSARRLPVTTGARRERLLHWSRSLAKTSWRLLKFPFVNVASALVERPAVEHDVRFVLTTGALSDEELNRFRVEASNHRRREPQPELSLNETTFTTSGRGWHFHQRPDGSDSDSSHSEDHDDNSSYVYEYDRRAVDEDSDSDVRSDRYHPSHQHSVGYDFSSDDDNSTAYWSTGTAMETDWEDSSREESSPSSNDGSS